MALTKVKFKGVASRLMSKAKDGQLVVSCVFGTKGEYNPVTATYASGSSETVQCVREDYQAQSVDGQHILAGDYKLIALVDDFSTIVPRPDNVTLTVAGVNARIVQVQKDAADAVYMLQVRNI